MDDNAHPASDRDSPWSRLKSALRQATAVVGMAGSTLSAQTAQTQAAPPSAPTKAVAGTPVSSATCFDGQIYGPQAERIGRSVVVIGVVTHDDKGEEVLEWFGSGFIVSNSATPGHPENKIVTAAHVISPLPDKAKIMVASSNALLFGTATVLKANWTENSAVGDVAAIAITQFEDENSRKDFNDRPGLDIGPQSRSEYRIGPFTKPAGLTGGISGGPVLNSAGQVIGLAESRFLGGEVTIQAPDFGDTTMDAKTQKPQTSEYKMDAPGPGFITAITPEVLAILGSAGRHISRHDDHSVMQVRALGAPNGACLVIDGQLRKIDFKTLKDFRLPDTVPPESRYAYWEDPKRAMPHLIDLLAEAKAALPDDKKAAFYAEDLKQYKQIEKIPKLEDFGNSLDDMAAASKGKNTSLADRLTDAGHFIGMVVLREDYRDPKIPFVRRVTSALKHPF